MANSVYLLLANQCKINSNNCHWGVSLVCLRTYIGSYWSIIKVGSKSQLAPNYLNGSGIQELKIQKSQRDVHGGFFISDTINADFFAYSFESFAALTPAESCLKISVFTRCLASRAKIPAPDARVNNLRLRLFALLMPGF